MPTIGQIIKKAQDAARDVALPPGYRVENRKGKWVFIRPDGEWFWGASHTSEEAAASEARADYREQEAGRRNMGKFNPRIRQ